MKLWMIILVGCGSSTPIAPPLRAVSSELRTPADFVAIADRDARSVALFQEMARVITSPRCMNCHPADRRPTQGDDRHAHVPMMQADIAGVGCATCHQTANVVTYGETIASIPGHPHWGLAPASMAWQGKTVPQICAQLVDPERNGHRTLAMIHEHLATDSLVGWAWHPGEGRVPAPGTQAQFGELVTAWIQSGARCPR
ncbi:MAG: Isoquinoline 1-oxidoreductase subunit [Kofleriaceae bacterium]